MQEPTIHRSASQKDSSDLSDLVLEKTRHPLHRLEEVPIDEQYEQPLTALLAEHGALLHKRYTKAYKRCSPGYEHVAAIYHVYTILFPPGTTRAYKLRLRSTTPFEILFPDGYRLHGAEFSPMSIWAQPLIILYLPKA